MNGKKILAVWMTLLLAFQLVGCGDTRDTATDASEEEKMQIVFEYQDGHVNEDFESKLEEKFDVDIVMDMNISTNTYLRLEQELTHDITQEKNTLQSVLSEKLYLKKGGELIIIISPSIMKKIL